MITIDTLRAWGANVDEGLQRCMNMEAFYLRLVNSLNGDTKVAQLQAALDRQDLAAAFEIAHSLKGVYLNLALTPLAEPVSRLSDLLKARTEMDYSGLMAQIQEQKEKFDALF